MLTPEEFKNAMALIDHVHRMMDELMATMLSSLGYKDGIDIFDRTMKWYA